MKLFISDLNRENFFHNNPKIEAITYLEDHPNKTYVECRDCNGSVIKMFVDTTTGKELSDFRR